MTSPSDFQSASPPGKPRRRRWGLIAFLIVTVLPVVGFTLYTLAALSFVYDHGDTAGIVQKISRSGWVCKTWEGQLAVNTTATVNPKIFHFSVRSDSIARVIEETLGKRVTLTYEQHSGVPTSCFGDTEYYVTGLRVDQ